MRRPSRPKPIEIAGATGTSRAASWIGFGLMVTAVAGTIVLVFVRFTGSTVLAIALVAFMLAYMAVMGWLAIRNIEGKR